MAHFAPDDLAALATFDVVCRGELAAGGAGDDPDVRARVTLRSRELKDLDATDRAGLIETLTDWIAPAACIVTDALAATPRGVRR